MIRFSAALVAVAIGVLIGGIVASELLLVYIAIALSAVALVALAAGVVLKREELFGEGQGLAPAQAGASPGLPSRSGEALDHVTTPPLQGAAVGPGAAFAAHSEPVPQPASPQPVSSQSAVTRETQPGHDSWGAPPAAAPVFGTWQAPAASGATPGWGTAAPSVFAPRTADTTAAARAAGQAAAPPSWFNPADKAASPESPATTRGPASGGGGWSWLHGETALPDPVSPDPVLADPVLADPVLPDTGSAVTGKPEDAAALDDDWPTRYSWLDDEPEEDGGAGDGGSPGADGTDAKAEDGTAAPADAAPESDSAAAVPDATVNPAADAARASVTGKPSGGSGPGDGPGDQSSWPSLVGAPTVAAPTMAAPMAAAPTVSAPAVTAVPVPGTASTGTTGTGTTGTGLQDTVLPDTGGSEPAVPETVESPELHLVRDPDPGTEAAAEPEGEPSATAAGETPGLVSVVRGVPRFHREDCVLIRFMPAGDTQKMPVAQAREAGCTPCTACEPEG